MPSTNIKHKLSRRVLSKSTHKTYATQLLFLCGIITSFVYVLGASMAGSIGSVYADSNSSTSNGAASDTTTVTLNLTSAISIRTLDSSMSSEIEALNLELTPTPSGRFVKDTSIIDVATSNATGYTLYMTSSYTNPHIDTAELPADTPTHTTDLIHNDSSVASSYSIPTIDPTLGGTKTGSTISEAEFSMPNSDYRNRWGYSITEKDVAGTYSPIPAHNTSDTINDTITTAMEHSYTPVTIGVNVDTNIASGTYTNELTFTAIANALPITYTLNFDSNGADSGNTGTTTKEAVTNSTISGMPEDNPMISSTTASSYTFTLPVAIPTTSVSDYVFKEWNTKPDGTGVSYQPGDEFTIVADTSQVEPGERRIYAVWEELPPYYIYRSDSAGGYVNNLTTVQGTQWGSVAIATAEIDGIDVSGYNYVTSRTESFSFAYNSCSLSIGDETVTGYNLFISNYIKRQNYGNPRTAGQTLDMDISEIKGKKNIQLTCGSGGLNAPGSASVSSSYIYFNMRNNQWETFNQFWLHN